MFIVSKRDINAGEEIFYSYSWQYWKPRVKVLHEDIIYQFNQQENSNSYRIEPSKNQPYLQNRYSESDQDVEVKALDSSAMIDKLGLSSYSTDTAVRHQVDESLVFHMNDNI